jgi:RimJ/RimL family protein N-acetyltransferase
MTHYRRLAGTKCYLSPRSDDDTERFKRWDNDLDVILQASMNGFTTPATLLYEDPARAKEILKHMFVIVDAETDAPIGWCSLFYRLPENRRAQLAIMIGEKEFWGRGYGQEAVTLLLDYGFNILNLNSVELGVYAFNERAIRCYERIGFRRIGVQRESRIVAGGKHDTVLMDLLASEFESPVVVASIRGSQAKTRGTSE